MYNTKRRNKLAVWHRGREGVDIAAVRLGENLFTATVRKVVETDNDEWVNYAGTYTVPSG